eukprot:18866-Heterococcus_DN1.PRE.3
MFVYQVRLRDTLVELDQVRSENVRLSEELQASSEAVLESRRSVAAAKAEAAAAAAQSAARETAAANELRAAKEGATALQQQLREAMTAQDEAVKDSCTCERTVASRSVEERRICAAALRASASAFIRTVLCWTHSSTAWQWHNLQRRVTALWRSILHIYSSATSCAGKADALKAFAAQRGGVRGSQLQQQQQQDYSYLRGQRLRRSRNSMP